MSDITSMIAELIAAGCPAGVAASVVARAFVAGNQANAFRSDTTDSPGAEARRAGARTRMKRYRDNRKALGLPEVFDGNLYWGQLTRRDGGDCVYCGDQNPQSIDHMVPTSQGGTDHIDNLAIACNACNGGKSGRTPQQAGMAFICTTAEAAHVRYVRANRCEHAPQVSPSFSPSTPTPITTPSSPPAAAAETREPVELILKEIGVSDDPHWFGHQWRLAQWLDQWDLKLDVLPTIRRMMGARAGPPPRSPKFFEAAIADACAARLAPFPAGNPNVRSHAPSAANSLVAAGQRRIAELGEIIAAADRAASEEAAGGVLPSDSNVCLLPTRGRGSG